MGWLHQLLIASPVIVIRMRSACDYRDRNLIERMFNRITQFADRHPLREKQNVMCSVSSYGRRKNLAPILSRQAIDR